MSFLDKLKNKEFVKLCEINPPKGIGLNELYETTDMLKGRVDALLVVDMPSAVMQMSPMAVSCLLKKRGFDVICNVTCRDRNVLALQSDLLGAYALGIDNIYITDGEDIKLGDHPKAKSVYEVSAKQLIHIVQHLHDGYDSAGNKLVDSPKFNMGTFVNSNMELEYMDKELVQMEDKIEQGASYFLTPAVFDLKLFEKFITKVKKNYDVPVIAEILVLKSVATARFINKHVNNVTVPDEIIERLATAGDKKHESIKITSELVKGLKELCDGVYIIALGWESKIHEFFDAV